MNKLNTENIFKEYKDIVNIHDLQKMLGIGRNSAYKLLTENKIKYLKIGNKFLIPKSNVIEFISSCEVQND